MDENSPGIFLIVYISLLIYIIPIFFIYLFLSFFLFYFLSFYLSLFLFIFFFLSLISFFLYFFLSFLLFTIYFAFYFTNVKAIFLRQLYARSQVNIKQELRLAEQRAEQFAADANKQKLQGTKVIQCM